MLSIAVYGLPGDRIGTVAKEAIQVVQLNRKPIFLVFNDWSIEVLPGDTLEGVLRRFDRLTTPKDGE